jgi:molecular chaperone DnaK
VSAKDKGTGRQQKIVIQPSSGLQKDEVERLVKDAAANAEADKRKREEIELRNQADSAAYNAEKLLREHGDKVPAELKTEVEGKIAAVRSALQANVAGSLRTALNELQASLGKIGQHVYSQAGAAPGAGPAQGPSEPPPKGGGDTVEGEFREV